MGLFGPDVQALKKKGDVSRLIRVLAGSNKKDQDAAASALAEIGEPAVRPLMDYTDSVGEPAAIALAMIGDPAVQPVFDALWAGETRMIHPLTLLLFAGAHGVYEKVCDAALQNPHEAVRHYARVSLEELLGEGWFGEHYAFPPYHTRADQAPPDASAVAGVAKRILSGAFHRAYEMLVKVDGESLRLFHEYRDPAKVPGSEREYAISLRQDARAGASLAEGAYDGVYEYCSGHGLDGVALIDSIEKMTEMIETVRRGIAEGGELTSRSKAGEASPRVVTPAPATKILAAGMLRAYFGC